MTTLHKIRRNKDLTKCILMSILLIGILRIFYSIPTPGVNASYFKSVLQYNQLLGFVNMLSGSGLSNLSVMSLNITPYITASIIIQLLANIIPKLQELQKGMKDDQKKVETITILLGIFLAFMESLAIAINYGKRGLLMNYTWYSVLIVACVWTAGAAASSIVGKLIHEKYKFNGTSLILLLNILASYPSDVQSVYMTLMYGKEWYLQIIIGLAFAVLVFAIFLFTYYVQETEKPIRINYVGKAVNGANKSVADFPIKLCPGGVVPIIFASSLMTFPVMIVSFFSQEDTLWKRILTSSYWFNLDDPLPTIGVILYIVMIFGFSFYYTEMTLNASDIADGIKKQGGSIAGIRPGRPTELYLKKQMKGVVAIGAAALTIIALVPLILGGVFNLPRLSFLGTSIIITVGVLCELKKMIESYTQADNYTERKKQRGGLF